MRIIIPFMFVVLLLCGCGDKVERDGSDPSELITSNTSTTEKDSDNDNVSIVCEYTSIPTGGFITERITLNIRVLSNNTVEVYCTDFSTEINGEEVTIDYIYGETFEITNKQRKELISIIRENRIASLGDCSSDSYDGSYLYIKLFDKDGEVIHSCGGLNPMEMEFHETREAIFELLPDMYTSFRIRSDAEQKVAEYLSENYPDEYGYLAN